MAGNLLEMCELTKRFGHGSSAQVVVDGISMHVGEGQVYGLLGPNGAGKPTMPKMVCGMSHPSTEQIRIDGHEWTRDDLYGIGSLIEQPPLYPNLTACKNFRILKETTAIRSTNRGRRIATYAAVSIVSFYLPQAFVHRTLC